MTSTRQTQAQRFVTLTHMCDWVHNDERAQLATDLGLVAHWQTHAAYLEARAIAHLPIDPTDPFHHLRRDRLTMTTTTKGARVVVNGKAGTVTGLRNGGQSLLIQHDDGTQTREWAEFVTVTTTTTTTPPASPRQDPGRCHVCGMFTCTDTTHTTTTEGTD